MENEATNINEQLDILEETKSQIKQSIIAKGQEISANDSFRSYATKIDNIVVLNAQDKTITPTISQQVIGPDEEYNALSQVTVEAVTNTIDNNIIADNIKSGVTILGVLGTYNPYQIREYISETAMNEDIANIQEGEVVSVVSNNITTLFIKETTMKKLVKEEDTMSPVEYNEALSDVDNILGEDN